VKGELLLAVGGPSTPSGLVSSLAVVADGGRLPRLVKGLKVESIETPVEQGAETVLVEVLGVVEATLGFIVVGTHCRNALVKAKGGRNAKGDTYQQ